MAETETANSSRKGDPGPAWCAREKPESGHAGTMFWFLRRVLLWMLPRLGRETPKKLDLHIICDNYRTHKHPKVLDWLERHPRSHIHFVPTGSSWMNMVERYCRDITENHIRRGAFRSVDELECTPLEANDILAKHIRARAAQNGPRISGNLH